jgi:hypothetical protein
VLLLPSISLGEFGELVAVAFTFAPMLDLSDMLRPGSILVMVRQAMVEVRSLMVQVSILVVVVIVVEVIVMIVSMVVVIRWVVGWHGVVVVLIHVAVAIRDAVGFLILLQQLLHVVVVQGEIAAGLSGLNQSKREH